MFKNILLAFDGSEHSSKAAKLAGEICRSMSSDLWLITVFDPVPGYIGQPYLIKPLPREWKQEKPS